MSFRGFRLAPTQMLALALLAPSACESSSSNSDDPSDGDVDSELSPDDSTDGDEGTEAPGSVESDTTTDAAGTDPAATDGESVSDGESASGTDATEPAESPGAGENPDAGGPPAVEVPSERRGESLGQFTLTMQPERDGSEAYATFQGKVWASPVPERDGWETTSSEGDCLIREPVLPQCGDGCDPPAFCAVGDECATEPDTVDVGEVTVWGLANQAMTDSFVMTPLNPTTNQYIASGEARLSYPPLADGDLLTLRAEGGALEPFAIAVRGIAPVHLTVGDELPFEEDTPLELTWELGQTETARVEVRVNISHHGGTKGEIICDVEDTGAVTIEGLLVSRLLELGFAGFPEVEVQRYTESFANVVDDHVVVRMVAYDKRLLSIAGLTSCVDASECAEGEMCVSSMCVAPE